MASPFTGKIIITISFRKLRCQRSTLELAFWYNAKATSIVVRSTSGMLSRSNYQNCWQARAEHRDQSTAARIRNRGRNLAWPPSFSFLFFVFYIFPHLVVLLAFPRVERLNHTLLWNSKSAGFPKVYYEPLRIMQRGIRPLKTLASELKANQERSPAFVSNASKTVVRRFFRFSVSCLSLLLSTLIYDVRDNPVFYTRAAS